MHGFLGPNGAGKSTTIRILFGLLRADAGWVEVLGGDPWRSAPLRHESRKLVHTVLWIIAGLMASVFTVAGSTKLLVPRETLAKAPGAGWVLDFSGRSVKALGVVELLGATGLILPALLDIAPWLVPLAALGLGVIMVGAAIVESRRREFLHATVNLTYLALLLVVAWGRLGPESFG